MKKEILVLAGSYLDIRVNSGGLKIKDGFPSSGKVRETYINRGTNEYEHIVVLGYSGSITFEAVKWIIDQGILLTFLDSFGNVITSFVPQNHISGVVKRRQATAGDSFNLKISSWLLREKFKGQREGLSRIRDTWRKADWWTGERETRVEQAAFILLDRERALTACLNVDSQRVLEAQAAAAYWHCFEGIPLSWEKAKKIPLNWLAINDRTSPKTNSPRKAIDPFNAGLNYLYAVLESRVRKSCFINGIDPDFGIIHADHASRTSLVFDLMEPIRPKVDGLLFDWFMSKTFKPKDFFETREGICKISPNITSQIIPLVKELNPDIVKVVKEFAGFFKDRAITQKPEEFAKEQKASNRPGRVRQTRITFTEPVASIKKQAVTHAEAKEQTYGKPLCLECGRAFTPEKPGQKFCCNRHKDTYRKRLLRERRKAEGKCPQCGKPMAEGAKGTYKERLTYCEKCREYWKERYEKEKKNSFYN
ncbi:MAG: CRISPR-associated endonuclease Cas1 [Candidatus Bathyarchaeia archaeon]